MRILGESEDLIAVSKPAGLLIHPTRPDGERTLWHELSELLTFEIETGGQISLINRLDRETSGVVLVAKHKRAASRCTREMNAGNIKKRYVAFVYGWPDWETRDVDAPIIRAGEVCDSAVWLRRMVHPIGKPSITRFKVRRRLNHPEIGNFAEIEAIPITGRTHQIRVHLAHIGYPVIGDKLYYGDGRYYLEFISTGWTPKLKSKLHFSRQALHSEYIAIKIDGKWNAWNTPFCDDFGEAKDTLFQT